MKKIFILFSLFIILVLSFVFLKKFILVSEEEKIKQTVKLAVKYLNDKNYADFMKQFSIEYRDEFGNTWGSLFFFLKNNLKHYKKVKVSVRNLTVENIFEGEAIVKLFGKAEVVDPYGEIIREAGRFIVKFKKEGMKWKIVWIEEDKYRFD